MTGSRAASLIFGSLGFLLAAITWLVLYRAARVDRLREQLESLRDSAFDAARSTTGSPADMPGTGTVAWIESLARHAGLLTVGRFLMVWLFAGALDKGCSVQGNAAADTYSAEAAAIVRRHLVHGCILLAMVPRELLENRRILTVMVESGVR
jgi:hypothetical protein